MDNEALQKLVEESLNELKEQLAGIEVYSYEMAYIAKVLEALAEAAYKLGEEDTREIYKE